MIGIGKDVKLLKGKVEKHREQKYIYMYRQKENNKYEKPIGVQKFCKILKLIREAQSTHHLIILLSHIMYITI